MGLNINLFRHAPKPGHFLSPQTEDQVSTYGWWKEVWAIVHLGPYVCSIYMDYEKVFDRVDLVDFKTLMNHRKEKKWTGKTEDL